MKKLMVASLGLSLLTGTAMFAQNTSSSTDTMKSSKKKSKKKKADTTSTATSAK